jgi:hypothetical protein
MTRKLLDSPVKLGNDKGELNFPSISSLVPLRAHWGGVTKGSSLPLTYEWRTWIGGEKFLQDVNKLTAFTYPSCNGWRRIPIQKQTPSARNSLRNCSYSASGISSSMPGIAGNMCAMSFSIRSFGMPVTSCRIWIKASLRFNLLPHRNYLTVQMLKEKKNKINGKCETG